MVQHPAISGGERLLDALWRTPDRHHQIGVLGRQNRGFENLPVTDAADAAARALKLSGEGKEVYLACAEYLSPESRKAANAHGAWAFWMDIDCGEDKAATGRGYSTLEEARAALSVFREKTGLPEPTHIVRSGGGLHLYWVLDDAVTRDEWQVHASKLKALTNTCGFRADDTRTADIASVLRIPGTRNHKYDPARPVSLEREAAERIERSAMLAAIVDSHARLCNAPAAQTPGHPATVTAGGGSVQYPTPDLQKLRSALAILDPDCDEQTWKLRRLAPLATAARNHPDLETELYELGKSWSSGELTGKASRDWTTPGGDGRTGEQAYDPVWRRFLHDHYAGKPATLGSIYHDARQEGWVDPTATPVKASRRDDVAPSNLPFPAVEPWPYQIDPAEVLDEISTTIRRYIVMETEQTHAAALWVTFTWLVDVVGIAPLAIINAPEKSCGKSQLLDVMGRMSARPLPVSNVSTASLFRSLELWSPTLLIDEADTFIRSNEELKGLINAGHTRTNAFVLRVVGDNHEPRRFSVWGAKALAGITLDKHLHDSTMSRAIVINLRRKLPHEKVERLRHAEAGLFEELSSKLARFAEDYAERVRRARPELPEALSDRAQDNWEPLLAIAGCAGPEWVQRGNDGRTEAFQGQRRRAQHQQRAPGRHTGRIRAETGRQDQNG